VRIGVAVDDVLALADHVAVVDGDVLALGDEELDGFARLLPSTASGVILIRRLFL
jgi:hypothetical protein